MARPITVKVKRLPGGEGLPLPTRMTEQSAGFDVCAAVVDARVLQPGDIGLIPCGFAMAIPRGYEAQVRPRSGLASKHGITMINTPGTIDSDYRGEVQVILINHGAEAFVVRRGMRVAQLVVAPVTQVAIVEVAALPPTERAAGGLGSTGLGAGAGNERV